MIGGAIHLLIKCLLSITYVQGSDLGIVYTMDLDTILYSRESKKIKSLTTWNLNVEEKKMIK